jgi:hypothetical protein
MRLVAVLLAGLVVLPSAISAAPISAWEFTNPGNAFTNGSWVFGINFTVGNSNLTVSSLGYYDDSGDGFNDNHEVGMYDSGGTLLSSTTVTSASPLIDHFRFQGVTPFTLLAGQTYRVVGVSHSDLYTWNDPGFAANTAITYGGDIYDAGTTLFDPTTVRADADGVFGPNFQTGAASSVPEPATCSLLALGNAALVCAKRRSA